MTERVLTHTDPATGIKTHIVVNGDTVVGIEVQEGHGTRVVPSKIFTESQDTQLMQMKARGFKAKAIAERLGISRSQVYARYYLLVNGKGVKHSGRHVKPTRLNTRISAAAANLVRDYSKATNQSLATALDSILRSTVVKEYVEPARPAASKVIWVNEHEDGYYTAHNTEEKAKHSARYSRIIRIAVKYVEAIADAKECKE